MFGAPAGNIGAPAGNFASKPGAPWRTGRRLLSELLGTFALTLVAAGAPAIGAYSGGKISLSAAVVAPALLVMAMIYTLGGLSGAHFNPVVTLAFTLRRDFPLKHLPGYWASQLVGAVAAAAVLRALVGTAGHLGATLPTYGDARAVSIETLLTFLLVTVILGTAAGHKLVGHNAALAVGGYIALAGLFAAPLSGASMNPARSFGPDLIGGTMGSMWVYVVGPAAGAILAVGLARLLHGGTSSFDERGAAIGGDGGGPDDAGARAGGPAAG
ncbi:MAG: MIP/aquaporin family protein [Acidimicrobiales bacterium]